MNGNQVAQSSLSYELTMLLDRFSMIKLGGKVGFIDGDDLKAIRSGNADDLCVWFYSKPDIKLLMEQYLTSLNIHPSDIKTAVSEFWSHRDIVVYTGVGFYPTGSKIPPGTLNSYIPPMIIANSAVSPDFLLNFLKEVICNNGDLLFDYLIKWLAHALQKPHEKPRVMLVLIGEQGVGKGLFLQILQRIWRGSTLITSSSNRVVGQFNASLDGKLIVILDEALFEGDRKSQDAIKSLVTEPVISIEQKHQPSRQVASFHRFVATTNHQQFTQLEKTDRRYCFFGVSSKYRGDGNYFDQLAKHIEDDGELGGLVDHLMSVDLSGFRPDVAIHSKLRDLQMLSSLQGFEAFWFQCLLSAFDQCVGDWSSKKLDWDEVTGGFISSALLLSSYEIWSRAIRTYRKINYQDIKLFMDEYVGNVSFRTTERGYKLPPLKVLRKKFETTLGLHDGIEWGD